MRTPGRTFEEVAELYHRVRPRYPERWFDRIAEVTGITAAARVLEIGSGTGIATRPMLERGWHLQCIEPGADLAAVARRELTGFPNLTISTARFEDAPIPPASLDLVTSATAFHWTDPAVRYVKSHDILVDGGHLAVIQYRHVAGGDEPLFDEIQDCYVAHMPATRRTRLPRTDSVTPSQKEMRKSGLLDIVDFQTMVEIVPYTTDQYMDLLTTYSGHRMLEPDQLDRLLTCIAGKIDREGGVINKAYAQELVIGRKLPA
jgi:SAM-dependent methyltransferase